MLLQLQMEGVLSMAQSATKLMDENKVLRDTVSEGKQLRSEMQSLTTRAAEDAAASKRLQQELAQAISDLTVSQDQLQVCRAELQHVQQQACSSPWPETTPLLSSASLVHYHLNTSVCYLDA
jgi:regulator of replication initiation timing